MNVMETIRTMETMNTEKQEMTFEEVHELVKNMSLPQAKPREGALMMTCLDGVFCATGSGSVIDIVSMLYAFMIRDKVFAQEVLMAASLYKKESDKSDKDNKNNGNNERDDSKGALGAIAERC